MVGLSPTPLAPTSAPTAVAAEKAAASAAAASLGEKGASSGAMRNVAERKEWTTSDDILIRESVHTHGFKWRVIAALLPGRSDDAVRNRWNRLNEAEQPKPLAVEADASSAELSESCLHVLSGKAAPRRPFHWRTNSGGGSVDAEWTKPERVSWSRQEDETIVHMVSEYGHKWGRIAQQLPGRTEHAIRNRYSRLQTLIEMDRRATPPSLPLSVAACRGPTRTRV